MTKKYVACRMPPEFKKWLENRKVSMENMSRRIGGVKTIPLTRVMRIISKTDGVVIDDKIFKISVKRKGGIN